MDSLLPPKTHHRHVKEIPLAPILDLLVVVIFFLVLSTSFMEFAKQTLPPSSTKTISDPVAPPPLAPKIFVAKGAAGARAILRWGGISAGQSEKTVPAGASTGSEALMAAIESLVADFAAKNPNERSIQLGLGSGFDYQDMVSAMDGAQTKFPDVVLISSEEAEAIASGTAP